MTLKFKINLTAGVIFFATVAVLMIFSFIGAHNILQSQINKEFTNYATDIGEYIDGWIKDKYHEMDIAADTVQEKLNDRSGMISYMDALAKSGGYDLLYYGQESDGAFIPSTPIKLPEGYDARIRPWYTNAKASNNVIITEPYIDASSGDMILSYAKAIRQGGSMLGVVACDLKVDFIKKQVLNKKFGETGYSMLMDKDGLILIHPDNKLIMKKKISELDPSLANASNEIAGRSSGFINFSYNGEKDIMFFYKLKNTDWVTAVVFSVDEVFSPLKSLMTKIVITALIFLVIGIVLLSLSIRISLAPLGQFIVRLRDIVDGEGDLSKTLRVDRKDELGELAVLFNKFVLAIRNILLDVRESSEHVASATDHFSSNVASITKGLKQQNSSTIELAAAVEEMNTTIGQIAHNAQDTATQANRTMDKATEGQVSVTDTVDTMNSIAVRVRESSDVMVKLGQSTGEIGNILNVINDIADQTNLLALNAAIEAARAGEHGRGFAVVADEVRKLAERTQSATGEITGMISNLQGESKKAIENIEKGVSEVRRGTEVADQAGTRLTEILDFNTVTTDMINQIAAAAEQQSATTNEIAANVSEISSITSANTEELHGITEASYQLKDVADSLKSKIAKFRL